MKKISIIWLLFGLACRNITDKKASYAATMAFFKQTADSIFANNSKKSVAYIILPNSGCGGCISSVETLLVEYGKKNLPLRFILTNINSLKSIRNTFGDSVVFSSAVYVDRGNIFYTKNPSFEQIYPVIVYLGKTGNPEWMEYVSPQTPYAINHLRRHIDSLDITFKPSL